MLTILNPAHTEFNPRVIRRTSLPGAPYDSDTEVASGVFARVSITTGEDWALIKLMRHSIDYYAPASGNGLLVHANLLMR